MGELERARGLLAEAIGTDFAAVPEDARIGQFDPWDSLAHLRLILSLEEQLGRPLDSDEVIGVECLHDVARLLNARGADA